MMTEKTISQFLSDEYKEFAMYVIEGRAIPSVIDGFKPTQRKIIHIANQILLRVLILPPIRFQIWT